MVGVRGGRKEEWPPACDSPLLKMVPGFLKTLAGTRRDTYPIERVLHPLVWKAAKRGPPCGNARGVHLSTRGEIEQIWPK